MIYSEKALKFCKIILLVFLLLCDFLKRWLSHKLSTLNSNSFILVLERDDLLVKNKMVNAWVDFISFGKPIEVENWVPVQNTQDHLYLNISSPTPMMSNSSYISERMILWEDVLSFYDDSPVIEVLV